MNWNLFWLFVVLNIINVVVQTFKSLITIKSGKTVAALVNAGAYALYTVVTIYMLCDLPLLWKAVVVGLCNLIGVYFVKWLEEKTRKSRLWKVEATIPRADFQYIKTFIDNEDVPANYIDINKYYLVNFYCATQAESALVRELLNRHNAKYFVTETKEL